MVEVQDSLAINTVLDSVTRTALLNLAISRQKYQEFGIFQKILFWQKNSFL